MSGEGVGVRGSGYPKEDMDGGVKPKRSDCAVVSEPRCGPGGQSFSSQAVPCVMGKGVSSSFFSLLPT